MVPAAAWDQIAEIGISGYATLGALAHHCDRNGLCYPSEQRLADMLCLSSRQVRRNLARLKAAGLIQISHRRGTSSLYRVALTPDMDVRLPRTPVSAPPDMDVQKPRTPVSAKQEVLTRSTKQEEKQSEFLEDFELWKSTLPVNSAVQVKPSKDRLKKYEARRRDSTREEIRDALRGWQYDPWPERKQNNGFGLLLKSRGQVEKFARLYRERNIRAVGAASLTAQKRQGKHAPAFLGTGDDTDLTGNTIQA